VKDAVDETDTGRLVGIRIGQFDVHFPQTTFKGRCRGVLAVTPAPPLVYAKLTLRRALESDEKFLPAGQQGQYPPITLL
jgi:hypothetical protein